MAPESRESPRQPENRPESLFQGGMTARFESADLKKYRLDLKSPTLLVLLGSDAGLRIPLQGDEVTLGRTNDADIMLHDEQISRRHAAIRFDSERQAYTITDLGSTNGTRLNLQDVKESVLQEGDKIFIGSTVLKFTLQDEVESEHGDALHKWVFTDDLTGLVVKRRFYSQLQFQLQRAIEQSEILSLVMMDLDGLKGINDAHGHATGAYIIAEVGKMIGEIINPVGLACRFGGDEFVAYLPKHDLTAAKDVCERIRSSIKERVFEKDGKSHRVSISIGVAAVSPGIQTMEALNQAADEALYRAKGKGRDCVSD